MVAALARRLGRPVKWIEERRENLVAASQARGQRTTVEVAADGRRHGCSRCGRASCPTLAPTMRIRPPQVLEPLGTASILPGPYRASPAYACEAHGAAQRTSRRSAPTAASGMTMGAFVMERMLDLVAERLGLDPAEVRRRNLIPREAYPYTSASGLGLRQRRFSQGARAGPGRRRLRRAPARADEAARDAGRSSASGIACYTEYTGMGSAVFRRRGMVEVPGIEAATVTVDPDGTVRCAVSFPTQGQGHATADRADRGGPSRGGARARSAPARRHRRVAARQRHVREPRRRSR